MPAVHHNPLRVSREPLISADQSARVHTLAKQILAEIGMEVVDPNLLGRLAAGGLSVSGNRVFFDGHMVDEYVEEIRSLRRSGDAAPDGLEEIRLTLRVSSYSLFVHDIDADKVVEFTTERLIEMTKLIDSLSGDGVTGAPPGIPVDVHPHLQPIEQYRIAALFARQGATPVDPTSPRTARYILDMAEVMGNPIDSLPVYIPTPLRLGGESLDVVLACLDRIDSIWVSSMPAAGTSAPIHPFGGLALAAAETIGGAIAVRVLTNKPTMFSASLFPSDLREGSMVFGSPENMLYYMLGEDFSRFYGNQTNGAPDNIHVMSKLPDGQSAAEKAAILSYGASLGMRSFSCAGTLSLDEVFSPEQLLLDCEIRDWVQRSVRGVWLGEEAVEDWLSSIRQGINSGFIAQDTTLDHFRTHVWYPKRFERGAIGPWLNRGQPRLSDRLRGEVRKRIANFDFELDAVRRAEIESIYQAAVKAILD